MSPLITICLAMAFSMAGLQGPQEEQSAQDLSGYTLAELKLSNTVHLNSEMLRDRVFSVKGGDPYDTQLVKEGLEKIVRLYGDMGYIDFAYTPYIDINQSEKTVSCAFDFIPGTRYFVNRIQVFGAGSGEEEKEIKSAVSLEENRLFSLSALDRSVGRLKALLEAKNLALKDYEFKRSSDHPGTVDVSIWVQPEE
jgi:outer membrane protein assembly factor BamA